MQKSNIKMQDDKSKVKSRDAFSDTLTAKGQKKFLHFYLSF